MTETGTKNRQAALTAHLLAQQCLFWLLSSLLYVCVFVHIYLFEQMCAYFNEVQILHCRKLFFPQE